MKSNNIFNLAIRYTILFVLSLGNLYIFYRVFTPITLYVSSALLSLFFSTSVSGVSIIFDSTKISLVSACIAGSAYYLLTVLNLSTPMNIKKRAKNILFLLVSFFVLNVIRIVIFSLLFATGYKYFSFTHELTWYLGSTLFVVVLWFVGVKLYKIRKIPFYTDLVNLVSLSKTSLRRHK